MWEVQAPIADTYIMKRKTLSEFIEYDGIQHFEPVAFNGNIDLAEKNFKMCQLRDERKTVFAQNNNLSILRISYTEDVQVVLTAYFSGVL
jgi:hypothetical protein